MAAHGMLTAGDGVVVAVSGGVDSMVLLHVLAALRTPLALRLHAAHLDHGLRGPEATRDAEAVAAWASRLEVALTCERAGPLDRRGGSLQRAARAARYAFLERVADRWGAQRIAVGHSQDDVAETVLLNLLRGAGLRGLAGIPPVRGRVIRPLFDVPREAILAYARAQGVPWVEDPSNRTPAWETAELDKIAGAVAEACGHLTEAQLGTGYGRVYIGYNRRRLNPDGTVTMFWRNQTHVPTAPVDPTVSVLRVDASDGNPLAVLVNYSCHPVVFGPDNLQFSADFPGVMTKTVEQAFGPADLKDKGPRYATPPLCFFLQGAPGDINVYDATTPLKEDAVGKRDWSGRHLGEEAARVAKTIKTEAAAEPSLEFVEDSLPFHLRWNLEKLQQGLVTAFGADFLKTFAPRIRADWDLPVATLLINKRLAVMTMPGEPFVDFQINWRDRCPLPDAFFLGYANGYYGYFPTMRAATEGGYGAAGATTWIEVGAGERMVDHALVRVYELLGRLTDTPEDLKGSGR